MAPRTCRACGIDHIEPGLKIDGQPLCWFDEDLCSACADRIDDALHRDAERYRYLRNRPCQPTNMFGGGVFAGLVPENLILGGEDLDRAVDAAMGADVNTAATLERRLADCLADCIDAVLLTARDLGGSPEAKIELRIGSFNRELSERAAELLEEAGL